MSNNKSANNYTTTRFQEVSLEQKIKVTMPDDFLNKVKYLCRAIPEVEWSGILFYTVNGTIKDPANMEVILKDILPMDKGDHTFTSYNLDNRFVDYLMDNQEAMAWKVGHIHSHNTMGVFFSATDMDELHDNAPNYDSYLSLIVNNFMDFKAKIAKIGHAKVESIIAPYTATDENGEEYSIDQGKFFVDIKRLYTYDCEIVSSVEQIDAPDYFKKGVTKIMEAKKPMPVVYKNYGGGGKSWSRSSTTNKGKKNKQKQKQEIKKTPVTPDEKLMEQYNEMAEFYSPELFPDLTDIELFAMALFNLSGITNINDHVEGILEELTVTELDDQEIALKVVESCVDIYSAFFPDRTDEQFVLDIAETIEMIEQFESTQPQITRAIEGLKHLIKYVEQDERVTTIE